MNLSCFVSALDEGSGPLRYWRRFRHSRVAESKNLKKLAGLGFRVVDICSSMQKSPEANSSLKALEMKVSCVALTRGAPPGAAFDSDDPERVCAMVQHTNQALDHAAYIGAGWAYIVPELPGDEMTLSRYAAHCIALAERGIERGVRVCVEHFPETSLPTVQATLAFIREMDHPNLYLLFDIGHAQITKENPADILPLAGDRLAYIHLNDNDGERDLHWALTDGMQTPESLAEFFQVLGDIGYTGPLSLEINRNVRDPLDAIRRSKQIVEKLTARRGCKHRSIQLGTAP